MNEKITIEDLDSPISDVSNKRLFTSRAREILREIEEESHNTINSIASCALKQRKISERQIKALVEWYNQELT